ncbi:hydroxyethylthiazole kinase [Saccharibacillus kuerlensis]|uniref:Hydroxyethylthiazole kinase n=1 Tax=Saccharibacillus kuerlensis TaxID=459527 RepID=A0ABQ2L0W5_9BACL|nr:hydroxyethylthiazole kinase [Saccharibacillus kuerlensis]GGN98680.1 hydroxyethylthiazole kinase [Saccharibacillus kuerlensis]
MEKELGGLLDKLHSERPLVHNITNTVVTNFTANGLLALGASPVMAYAREEVADMAKIAGAVVLNIGTLTEELVEACIIAGQAANEVGVPVLLDPVGAGATPYRTDSSLRILREVKVSIVRGNAAEIAHLTGEIREIKGVDAGAGGGEAQVDLAVRAAIKLGTAVAVTGREDVITDGASGYVVSGGDELLARVTGAGCLLTSVMGAFAAVERDMLKAGAAAMALYGAAAESAVSASGGRGPGSFQVSLLDELAGLRSDSMSEGRVRALSLSPVIGGGAR